MRVQITIRSDPQDPSTEVWTRFDFPESDLELSGEDFAKRFLIPAWYALKNQMRNQKENNARST